MCVFNVFLCVWEQIPVTIFCLKIYFLTSEKPNDFFYLFLQHVSLTLFHLCSHWLWQSTLSTDPQTSKSCVFEKIYTSVFSIRTPVKDEGFILTLAAQLSLTSSQT